MTSSPMCPQSPAELLAQSRNSVSTDLRKGDSLYAVQIKVWRSEVLCGLTDTRKGGRKKSQRKMLPGPR